MLSSDLKPCPFCGGEAATVREYYPLPYLAIYCTKCQVRYATQPQLSDYGKVYNAMCESWNRRVSE